jgi:hypothetical protein
MLTLTTPLNKGKIFVFLVQYSKILTQAALTQTLTLPR